MIVLEAPEQKQFVATLLITEFTYSLICKINNIFEQNIDVCHDEMTHKHSTGIYQSILSVRGLLVPYYNTSHRSAFCSSIS